MIFNPSGVSDVKLLKYGKVYLLTMGDGSNLVIKAEAKMSAINDRIAERKAMDFGFQIAQKLASAGSARVMDQLEVKGLARLRAAFPDPELGWDVALDPNYNHVTSWLLMEAAGGLKSLDDASAGENKKIFAFFMLFALHEKSNLLALGKILAMDCFLGNSDRFIVDESKPGDPIKNMGNVFFAPQNDNTGFKVVGLDPLDPNSGWAKLDQDILTVTQGLSESLSDEQRRWPGLILKSDKRMRDLSKRCLRAVNDHLTTNAGLTDKEKKTWDVRGKHFDLVEKGMKQGRDEIKLLARARVAAKGGRAKAPAGLVSRMKLLGWA
jgi:hypothetical protein